MCTYRSDVLAKALTTGYSLFPISALFVKSVFIPVFWAQRHLLEYDDQNSHGKGNKAVDGYFQYEHEPWPSKNALHILNRLHQIRM
jgi:hypothetical protein